ncbi:glycosyltransferase [Pseudomonas sp. R2.Fl]|nr:glycosyltransferase [Pseudomonas sp. R2.Fl]
MERNKELALLRRIWRAESAQRECDIRAVPDKEHSRVQELENSVAYRLGRMLTDAARSPRAALRLPLRFASLLSERFATRAVTKALPRPASDTARKAATPDKGTSEATGWIELPVSEDWPSSVRELRMAAICDRFTADNLALECKVEFLEPGTWAEQLRTFRPHILLVESAWQGLHGEWAGKVATADSETARIIGSCKHSGIKTIFWNKEDPLHFEAFIGTARLCDLVCTTDAESIPAYKRELGHERVYLLPFALQPRLHNPIRTTSEGIRRNATFFAGAWYGNLHERCVDFGNLADALMLAGTFHIYDRNSGGANNTNAYPQRYQRTLRESVPYDQTAALYKGYVAGLTINTVKQSSSMFARRALELMGVGTSVYSNHCRALRLLFGDLVVSTDNGESMLQAAFEELSDPDALTYRVKRLAASRKVMREHTWTDRLEDLWNWAGGQDLVNPAPIVTVISRIHTDEQMTHVLAMAAAQVGVDVRLLVWADEGVEVPPEVRKLNPGAELEFSVCRFVETDFAAAWHPADRYGPHYLADLLAGSRFGLGNVLGKAGFRILDGVGVREVGNEYCLASSLAFRRCLFSMERAGELTLRALLEGLELGGFEGEGLVSMDALSYLEGGANAMLPEDELPALDEGVTLREVIRTANMLEALPALASGNALSGAHLAGSFDGLEMPFGVSAVARRHRLELVSRMPSGRRLSIVSGPIASDFRDVETVHLDAPGNTSLDAYLEQRDAKGNVVLRDFLPFGSNVAIGRSERMASAHLVTDISGSCVTHIDGLWLKAQPAVPPLLVGGGRVLMVVNGYPSTAGLYRNAFVHRRVRSYRERGVAVDVVWVKEGMPSRTYEFDGICVNTCSHDALAKALEHTQYSAIAVHFLDRMIWSSIARAAKETRTVVWLHGSDIQSWKRRDFNYRTDEERRAAMAAGAERDRFWRELWSVPSSNLHFVFVSAAFADETFQDLGVRPAQDWSVIHNPIDTALFEYQEKDPEHRWNILSVRPHASRIYANDLVSKAIRVLSKSPFFPSMRFHLIGDGEMFEENFNDLKEFANVRLERRFVGQCEIAELHRGNGIFLVPTRGDTQGVSRDEAMSSGLVPVTNDVGSIREFVDESCAILAQAEDESGLAEGIERLVSDAGLFLRLSAAAARRVRSQSDAHDVMTKELRVLGMSG